MEKLKNEALTKNDLEEIKKDLLERKKAIEADILDITDKKGLNVGPKFPDFGDKSDENAQEIDEYSTNLATEQVLEKSLRDINSALARIKNKSYGKCKYCGKPINPKRLKARPVASACIECKTKLQNS